MSFPPKPCLKRWSSQGSGEEAPAHTAARVPARYRIQRSCREPGSTATRAQSCFETRTNANAKHLPDSPHPTTTNRSCPRGGSAWEEAEVCGHPSSPQHPPQSSSNSPCAVHASNSPIFYTCPQGNWKNMFLRLFNDFNDSGWKTH